MSPGKITETDALFLKDVKSSDWIELSGSEEDDIDVMVSAYKKICEKKQKVAVLKLCGKIDWSWWWVTSPLWMPLASIVAMIVFVCIMIVVVIALEAKL